MLEEFGAWWLAQWRETLPQAWRDAGADRTPVLLVEPEPLEAPVRLAASLRERGAERRLGELSPSRPLAARLGGRPRPATTLLRLPPGRVLGRDVTLPLAAERDLARVLAFEMDRLTPFAADELHWGWTVLKRDRAAGRVLLRLALVPKTVVAAALAALDEAGVHADAIEGTEGDGALRRIPLAQAGAGRVRREQVVLGAAWGAVALLALLAVAVPFLRQGGALAATERRIALLRPAVREADALRGRITAATAGADVLSAARHQLGDPLATLASLTDALPDDTFLTDLSLTGRKLTINGQSASAAKLIGALSANPAIRNPSFVAPVTRLETAHTDLFSIRADLAP